MSLNATPSADRLHIGFFGRRNVGKSSLINAIAGQQLSIVSETMGTTTDPVRKAMEILPIGPVELIDTPGFDDEGALGRMRVRKTQEILKEVDLAIFVFTGEETELSEEEERMLRFLSASGIPSCLVFNQCDRYLCQIQGSVSKYISQDRATHGDETLAHTHSESFVDILKVSAKTGEGVEALKKEIIRHAPKALHAQQLLRDQLKVNDRVILVIPIDESAPKGRIILPQQQVLREILDAGAQAIVCRDTELSETIRQNSNLRMVVIDSQAFALVRKTVSKEIPLTTFSILMARQKGFLAEARQALQAIETLQDGDRILIAEGCTHHRQCNDIGTVKIPRWLTNFTGKNVSIETCSGREFPEDLSSYRVVIHCGGCMLNDRSIHARLMSAKEQKIPFLNYGVLIVYMLGQEIPDEEGMLGRANKKR